MDAVHWRALNTSHTHLVTRVYSPSHSEGRTRAHTCYMHMLGRHTAGVTADRASQLSLRLASQLRLVAPTLCR